MTTRQLVTILAPDALSLAATDGLLLSNGTIWSHAATLGPRAHPQGDFAFDRDTISNFVRVFNEGTPRKIPVDYEHASTSDDPAVVQARAAGRVPKAGDVRELKGVFSVADFSGDLKAAAEKLAALAGRPLDDARNFGLWMRWQPTAKALQMIQSREMTELSVTFALDYPSNTTGELQGPTLLAVALTNLPFLDDMLPVAASRRDHTDPDTPASARSHHTDEGHVMKNLLTSLAAVTGASVTTEDEGVARLSALGTELRALRDDSASFKALAAEVGENPADPQKVLAKIRQLRADVQRHADAAAAAKKAQIDGVIAATRAKYEPRITPALFDNVIAKQLRAELEAGTALEATESVKALESMPETGITTQKSGGDIGGGNAAEDVRLDQKAKELMRTDDEVKELFSRDGRSAAFRLALSKARKELGIKPRQASPHEDTKGAGEQ